MMQLFVSYKNSISVIQASWNWPFGRKDMEIYGEKGYIIAQNSEEMRLKNEAMQHEKQKRVISKDIEVPEDPFAYFVGVIRGDLTSLFPEKQCYGGQNPRCSKRICQDRKRQLNFIVASSSIITRWRLSINHFMD